MNFKLLLCCFAAPVLSLTAQQHPSNYNYGEYFFQEEKSSYNKEESQKNKEVKLKQLVEISQTYNKRKPESKLTSTSTYNKDGQVTHFMKNFRKTQRVVEYKYENQLLSEKAKFNNSKPQKITLKTYSYDNKNQLSEYTVEEKGREISRMEIGYSGKATASRTYYYKGNAEPTFIWNYKYHEDGSKKETNYIKKGKLKYTWSYECDPAGKIEAAKDTTTICKQSEIHEDGSFTEYYKETDDKGKVILKKVTKTKDSTTIYYAESYLDGKMKSEWMFEDGTETYLYFKKGKIFYTRTFTFNKKDQMTSLTMTYKGKNKWGYKQEYKYDSKGLMTERLNYNRENQLRSKTSFVRTFY